MLPGTDHPVERTPGNLVVVCGLPGSGKTTHALGLVVRTGGVRLSADEWMDALEINLWEEEVRERIEELQWSLAQELLAAGLTVIIEWGTWGRSERDRLRLGAQQVGAKAELHYLEAPVEVLYERVRRRGMEDPPITREQLEQWARQIQVPGPEELDLFDVGVVIPQR